MACVKGNELMVVCGRDNKLVGLGIKDLASLIFLISAHSVTYYYVCVLFLLTSSYW